MLTPIPPDNAISRVVRQSIINNIKNLNQSMHGLI